MKIDETNIYVWNVSEISQAVKSTVESSFEFIKVKGEISKPSYPSSGHIYFSLKDETSVLNAVIWKYQYLKLSLKLEEGLEVICSGKLSTFPGGSRYQIIIQDIQHAGEGALLKQLEDSNHNHDHNQLRNNYKDFQETRPSEPVMNINSEHSFNRDLFNLAYEENREGDIFDKGYSDWMKKEDTNEELDIPSSLKNGNFNENLFHSEFSKHKKKLNKNVNSIIKYDQPQVDISYKGKDSLVILGQEKISDFSGESSGGLGYRDLKDAYTNTLLIDAEDVDISTRSNNINDKTLERKNISYELNEEGQMKEAKRISDEEISEKRRIERLRMFDEHASESYERIHTRMLGR